MSDELEFRPKAGGEAWVAYARENDFSGYDIALMLDKKNASSDSGWMIELGVDADGTIFGQITTRPGFDALVLFKCTKDKFTASDNWGGPNILIGN